MNLIYVQMLDFSRCWMYLRTIGRSFTHECLFSLDEQQKVYYINRGRTCHEAWRGRWRFFLHLFIYFSWLASVFNYHLMQVFLPYHWPRAPAPRALQMTAQKWWSVHAQCRPTMFSCLARCLAANILLTREINDTFSFLRSLLRGNGKIFLLHSLLSLYFCFGFCCLFYFLFCLVLKIIWMFFKKIFYVVMKLH